MFLRIILLLKNELKNCCLFLTAMSNRYKKYAQIFADILGRDVEELEPYVYIGITAATNYMIFGENSYIKPQFDLLKKQLNVKNGGDN